MIPSLVQSAVHYDDYPTLAPPTCFPSTSFCSVSFKKRSPLFSCPPPPLPVWSRSHCLSLFLLAVGMLRLWFWRNELCKLHGHDDDNNNLPDWLSWFRRFCSVIIGLWITLEVVTDPLTYVMRHFYVSDSPHHFPLNRILKLKVLDVNHLINLSNLGFKLTLILKTRFL